ncbi:MAG TPA: hypothetical protein VFW50_14330 [Streptosporangiaceae bacterium]|nr:hypothetical protein [Streptosporangiaceae bacterium]
MLDGAPAAGPTAHRPWVYVDVAGHYERAKGGGPAGLTCGTRSSGQARRGTHHVR